MSGRAGSGGVGSGQVRMGLVYYITYIEQGGGGEVVVPHTVTP